MPEQINEAKKPESAAGCCADGTCACPAGAEKRMRHCCSRSIGGWLVILIGVAFLLRALGILAFRFVDTLWPLLLIFVGASMLMKGRCRHCPEKQ